MASTQLPDQRTEGHSALDEWLITRVGDIAVYSTAVIGYLFSVLSSPELTGTGFFLFTAVNVLYLAAAWLTWSRWRRVERVDWGVASGVGAVAILTVAAGLLMPTGLEFDWLLYFATVGMSIVILPPWVGLAVTVLLYLSVPCVYIVTVGPSESSADWLSLLAGFGFVAAFSYSNRLLVTERERSRKLLRQVEESNRELASAHAQLQAYADEVEELAVARERTRMARDIHDTLGHYLTILSIQLETIAKLQERDPAQAAVEVAEARRVAAHSMQEVRNAVSALRPTSIATLSLPEALAQLGSEFQRVAGDTELTIDLDTDLPPLSADVQLALYRAAQEALTNVRKHARATKVLLRMRYEDEAIKLVVLDNATRVPQDTPQNGSGGFGLLGLRERVELLGGSVSYGSVEPSGYRVEVSVPVSRVSTRPGAEPELATWKGGEQL
ncbi:MAG TPA: sensor histidine kinase [Chloroflexia bacterium]|nr:sensor histidine kinase [Chloroflexia bacterium]